VPDTVRAGFSRRTSSGDYWQPQLYFISRNAASARHPRPRKQTAGRLEVARNADVLRRTFRRRHGPLGFGYSIRTSRLPRLIALILALRQRRVEDSHPRIRMSMDAPRGVRARVLRNLSGSPVPSTDGRRGRPLRRPLPAGAVIAAASPRGERQPAHYLSMQNRRSYARRIIAIPHKRPPATAQQPPPGWCARLSLPATQGRHLRPTAAVERYAGSRAAPMVRTHAREHTRRTPTRQTERLMREWTRALDQSLRAAMLCRCR